MQFHFSLPKLSAHASNHTRSFSWLHTGYQSETSCASQVCTQSCQVKKHGVYHENRFFGFCPGSHLLSILTQCRIYIWRQSVDDAMSTLFHAMPRSLLLSGCFCSHQQARNVAFRWLLASHSQASPSFLQLNIPSATPLAIFFAHLVKDTMFCILGPFF